MIEENTRILDNHKIAGNTYKLVLASSIGKEAYPGQFVQIQIPGFFLRRPFSLSAIEPDRITVVYKTAGHGTDALSRMQAGETLNVFGPLGKGFPVSDREVLLIGGGAGLAPLYETARHYKAKEASVIVAAGFNTADEIYYEKEFRQLGCILCIATMDGSYGTKGTALDAIKEGNLQTEYVLACGPVNMLRAVNEKYHDGFLSLEGRMACGIGVCHGCVVQDAEGKSYTVCHDGPVFPIGKVVL